MLNEILQAIKLLKNNQDPSKTVKETLDYLEQSVQNNINRNMLDLMAAGDVVGYEKLSKSLEQLANLIRQMDKKPSRKK